MAISSDYAREMQRATSAAAKTPVPQKPNPTCCRTTRGERVQVGDFDTVYDYPPRHAFAEPIRRVQRGATAVPFCPFEKRPVDLVWFRNGASMLGYFVCLGCRQRLNLLNTFWTLLPLI